MGAHIKATPMAKGEGDEMSDKTYQLGEHLKTRCVGSTCKDGQGLGTWREHEVIEANMEGWPEKVVRVKCLTCGIAHYYNMPLTLSDEDGKDGDD